MGRNKDGDGIKSSMIVSEVQKRACLFDSSHPHYGDRTAKARCWEEVCQKVVPSWYMLDQLQKFSAGKEVQKRWRSIRDSFTKAYRQGKCVLPEQCPPASRRYQHHKQMAFLLRALQNKKPRLSQEKDRYESFSEVSSSPHHQPVYELPQLKPEIYDKPLDLKTRQDKPEKTEHIQTDKIRKVDKEIQANLDKENVDLKNQLEIKSDANSILPDDHFDDDKLFMNSLLPLFRKMDDDTRLLCRIEVLKIIRYALQGSKCFEALKIAEDSFFKQRVTGILNGQTEMPHPPIQKSESSLSMVTRSADGSRPIRKRRLRSPSPLPMPNKRRGPGRPRKIRPPPSDSEEESSSRRRPKLKVPPLEIPSELDDSLNKATSITQLSTPMFMKMYNLERTNTTRISNDMAAINIKKEPDDESQT